MYNKADFFKQLEIGKIKKRKIDSILKLHASVYPEYINQASQKKHLRELLDILVKEGEIELPSLKGKAWREGVPRLPLWIKIINKDKKEDTVSITYAWHPVLAKFADSLNKTQKESAYLISEYLKKESNKGHFEIEVPRRERSLKIFNDEKRLDSLVNKGFLFGGNLTLKDIGCFDVAWPMPYEALSDQSKLKPFLIIENHHSFDSFVRWNVKSKQFSGIGYGSGEAFSSLESDRIEDIIQPLKVSEIQYLGDIDPRGIAIPARVNRARIEKNMMPILPAVIFYKWLLVYGQTQPMLKGKHTNYIKDWLPGGLQIKVDALFEQSLRIPQESLGFLDLLEFNKLK